MSSRGLCWNSVVAALVLILAFGYSKECADDEYKCVEDDSCISLYSVCDLTKDCPNGTDESYTECKGPNPEYQDTHCANGAPIRKAMFCNRVVDCLDGSDELPQLCTDSTNWRSKYRGQCTDNEIECLPGECVSESKTCNNEIDCSNGLDESLEMCMQVCDKNCFRCGNGVTIAKKQLCDNRMHCLDGTDELPYVCQGRENWVWVEPKICYEPLEGKFTNNTKFTVSHSKRFVYANQPAEVECWTSNQTSWNVCMNNGLWHHKFPDCKPKRTNKNPDTNGTNGCPINYYDEVTMLIKDSGNNPVYPPLKDVRVKFECLEGYDFLPYHLSDEPITCQDDKQWTEHDFHPRCVKLCPPEQINKMYTLQPTCYNGDKPNKIVSCKDKKSLIPGTVVKFECQAGFSHRTTDPISVTCTEDGTWDGIKDLCRNQDTICHSDCNFRLSYPVSPLIKDGSATNSLDAYWVVPIYLRKNTTREFEFQCTGNLIRMDVVLTSAHCIIDFESAPSDVQVGSTSNLYESAARFLVKSISIYSPYKSTIFNHDVGIIFLKNRMKFQQDQSIICLPYDYGNIKLDGKDALVTAWDFDGNLSYASGEISEPPIHNGDFQVTVKGDSKICHGDSGSGVTIQCSEKTRCLVGLISRTEGPGEASTQCKQNVTAASISSGYLKAFIEQSIKTNTNCPE